MRPLLVAALAAATLATVSPGAHAAAPGPLDVPCSHSAVPNTNPEAPDEWMIGPVQGGPIGQNGTLRCTVKVGVSQHDRPTPYTGGASGSGTTGVTTLPPTIVSYEHPPLLQAYLCSEFHDGTTLWVLNGATGTWTSNTSTPCVPI